MTALGWTAIAWLVLFISAAFGAVNSPYAQLTICALMGAALVKAVTQPSEASERTTP